jgi:hypothetical protein
MAIAARLRSKVSPLVRMAASTREEYKKRKKGRAGDRPTRPSIRLLGAPARSLA